ncbi:MAG: hypoxanthine-guanine phosphoribosyltransferase [Proteobacteria bacterium]|nr:hypoxanthine-guanine phosphoribosyltransferase [Pseudomonadota bacterium]
MNQQDITIEQAQKVLEEADVLYRTNEVEQAIKKMAESITAQLHESNPLILPVMIGGVVLAGKLVPLLNFPLQIDYIHATRYRGETSGSGLHWLKQPEKLLKDKIVLLIDDILDEGITLSAIINYCHEAGASRVLTAVLVEKELKQEKPVQHADFTGLTVPNRYVFGYGMDYHEYHRNLDGIYALKE